MPAETDSIEPLVLSPLEAARALRMSKVKLYGILKKTPDKAPPSYKIGANRYFPKAGLAQWLEKQSGDVNPKY